MTRLILPVILAAILGSASLMVSAAPPAPSEPPAPVASPAVQRLLEEAARLSQEHQSAEALAAAERALEAARQAADAVGEARAQGERAPRLAELGRRNDAAAAWTEAAAAWRRAGDGPGQVEALVAQAQLAAERDPAKRLVQEAVDLARAEARRPLAAASALNVGASALFRRGRLQEARLLWQEALHIQEKLAPGSLAVAASLNNLGIVSRDQSDLAAAQDYHHQALAIREKLAPDSLAVAGSLSNLGAVAQGQGDLATAREHHQRALAIQEKRAPGSLAVAASLNNLGVVLRDQGHLASAQEYHQRALAIREKLAPGSLDLAASLNNLGLVARDQRDLAAARDYHQRALAIQEKLVPESLDLARTLNDAGATAQQQGDLAGASANHRRALAIVEKLAPNSLELAANLHNLGNVARLQADLAEAESYYERARKIVATLAPDSVNLAISLNDLGTVAYDRGDLSAARDYYRRALVLWQKLSPGSLEMAATLNNLGNIERSKGNYADARKTLQSVLAMQEKVAPDSPSVGNTLNNLGVVAIDLKEWKTARDYLERALKVGERVSPNAAAVAETLSNLAQAARGSGDLAAAADFDQRARDIRQRLPPDRLPTLWVLCLVLPDPAWQAADAALQASGQVEQAFKALTAPDLARAVEVLALSGARASRSNTGKEVAAIAQRARPDDLFVLYAVPVSSSGRSVKGAPPVDDLASQTPLLRTILELMPARRRLLLLDGLVTAKEFDTVGRALLDPGRELQELAGCQTAVLGAITAPPKQGDVVTSALAAAIVEAVRHGKTVAPDGAWTSSELRHYLARRVADLKKGVNIRAETASKDFPLWRTRPGDGSGPPRALRPASPDRELPRQGVLAPRWASARVFLLADVPQPVGPTAPVAPEPASPEQMGAAVPRGVARATQTSLQAATPGKCYALLFATNEYEKGWDPLTNPLADAKRIATELQNRYGFEVELVPNPDPGTILKMLAKYRHEIDYQDEDQLFVFFAGHGFFNEDMNTGYLIARNTKAGWPWDNALSHGEIRQAIDAFHCKHIFVVLDVCFGGTFRGPMGALLLNGDKSQESLAFDRIHCLDGLADEQDETAAPVGRAYEELSPSEFIRHMLSKKTRQCLASGDRDPVPEGNPRQHSPFALRFLEALQTPARADVLTLAQIHVEVQWVRSKPIRFPFGSNEEGSEFLFIGKRPRPQ